jgi:prevent-host-death family protein
MGLTLDFSALLLCVMKTCSIMEAQHNLAALVRKVEAGAEFVVTRRRRPVARIVPIQQENPVFPDFKERAQKIWGVPWQGSGSDELLDESRGTR